MSKTDELVPFTGTVNGEPCTGIIQASHPAIKPKVSEWTQKQMMLLRDAIKIVEARGRQADDLREDLAYLEKKYRT